MNGCVNFSALIVAGIALSACGGAHMGTSSAPRDASLGRNVAPAAITGRGPVGSADASGPHGAEIESGVVISIDDGNMHMGYPSSATVERTADGVIVSINGKTRKFSRAATVSSGGSYHLYAPVIH